MARYFRLCSAITNQDLDAVHNLTYGLAQHELSNALLESAIRNDNPHIVSALVDAGAYVDHRDDQGRTAVFLAVRHAHVEVVRELVRRGCDVNLGKFKQSYCLHLAVIRGLNTIIQLLLDAGHGLNHENWAGNTPLLIACRFGRTEAVELLLSRGASVHIPNKMHHYPLHYAASTGNHHLVTMLLDKGACSNVKTHLGITPLMMACEQNRCEIVSLLAGRSQLDHREMLFGGSALHWAAMSGCLSCFDCLISCGACPNLLDHSGRTPLLQAIQSDRQNIAIHILKKSDKEFWNCAYNWNVLHCAASRGHVSLVSEFCQNTRTKHLVNRKDCFGDTALDVAFAALHDNSWFRSGVTTGFVRDVCAVVRILAYSDAKCSSSQVNKDLQSDCRYFSSLLPVSHAVQQVAAADGGGTESRHSAACSSNEDGYYNMQYESFIRLAAKLSRETRLSFPGALLDCEKNEELHLRNDEFRIRTLVGQQARDCGLSERDVDGVGPPTLYKTYSPVKMSIMGMLKSARNEQLVATSRFDFGTWLDNGLQDCVLKVTSLKLAEWVSEQTRKPWPLTEICRGVIRRFLGYRSNEKIALLPLPTAMRDFLSLKELDEIKANDILITHDLEQPEVAYGF